MRREVVVRMTRFLIWWVVPVFVAPFLFMILLCFVFYWFVLNQIFDFEVCRWVWFGIVGFCWVWFPANGIERLGITSETRKCKIWPKKVLWVGGDLLRFVSFAWDLRGEEVGVEFELRRVLWDSRTRNSSSCGTVIIEEVLGANYDGTNTYDYLRGE